MRYNLSQEEQNRIIIIYENYIREVKNNLEQYFAELEGIYLTHNYEPLFKVCENILLYWENDVKDYADNKIVAWAESDASIVNVLWNLHAFGDIEGDAQATGDELQEELIRLTKELFNIDYELTLITDNPDMKKDLNQIFSDFKAGTDRLKQGFESKHEDMLALISRNLATNNMYQSLEYLIDILFDVLNRQFSKISSYFDLSEEELYKIIDKAELDAQSDYRSIQQSIDDNEYRAVNELLSFSDVSSNSTGSSDLTLIGEENLNDQKKILTFNSNGGVLSSHYYHYDEVGGKKAIIFKLIKGKSAVNWNSDDWDLVEKEIPGARLYPAYFDNGGNLQKIPEIYKFPAAKKLIINIKDVPSCHEYHYTIKDDKKAIIFNYVEGKSAVNWNSDDWDLVERQISEARLLPAYFKMDGNIQKIPEHYKFPIPKIKWEKVHEEYFTYKELLGTNDEELVKSYLKYAENYMIPTIMNEALGKKSYFTNNENLKIIDVLYDKFIEDTKKGSNDDNTSIEGTLKEYSSYIHEMGHLIAALKTKSLYFNIIIADNIYVENDSKKINNSQNLTANSLKNGNICIFSSNNDVKSDKNDYLIYCRGSAISRPLYKKVTKDIHNIGNKIYKDKKIFNYITSVLATKFGMDVKMENMILDDKLDEVKNKISSSNDKIEIKRSKKKQRLNNIIKLL